MQITLLNLSRILVFVSVLVITSCVMTPQQKFDKSKSEGIRKIALLKIFEPLEFNIINLDGATPSFGQIVRSAQTAENKRHTNVFTQQLRAQKFAFSPGLVHALETELKARNYDVVYLSNQRPKLKDDKESDYATIQTDADVILDVRVLLVGYVSKSDTAGYVPWMRAGVKLISNKDKSSLYYQFVNYGAEVALSEEVHNLTADPKYTYQTFEALTNNVDEAAQGIRMGIESFALRLAKDLR